MRPHPASDAAGSVTHPPGLYLLFATEMWERFSYYGMLALLLFYMKGATAEGGLGWSESDGLKWLSWYTSLAYLTPIFGGYLADRFLGTHYAMLIGGLLIAAGHFTLAIESLSAFFVGLSLVVLGTGLFKPCVSVMVSQLYPEGDRRRDAAFTVFYMGINLGGFLGPLICGGLRFGMQTADGRFGWNWAFGAAGVGMVCGLTAYLIGRPYALRGIGLPPNRTARGAAAAEARDRPVRGEGVHYAPARRERLRRDEWGRVAAIFILAFFALFFWTAFMQAGSSLNLFAEARTDRRVPRELATWLYESATQEGKPVATWVVYVLGGALVGLAYGSKALRGGRAAGRGGRALRTASVAAGLALIAFATLKVTGGLSGSLADQLAATGEYPPEWFQSANPFWILVLAQPIALLWLRLGRRGWEPSTPLKFGLGLIILGLGFVFMVIGAARSAGPDGSIVAVSGFWLMAAYCGFTLGELCVSPVGLSVVNKLAPTQFVSLLMGVWFLSIFAANWVAPRLAAEAGRVAEMTPVGLGPYRLGGLALYFALFVAVPLVLGLVMLALTPVLKRLMHGRD